MERENTRKDREEKGGDEHSIIVSHTNGQEPLLT